MNSLIIDFKRDEDIMVPAPWPVGIDATNKVTSGLGNDDGSFLIGFAQPGVEGLAYMPEDIGDIDFEAEELVPVFSNGKGFFNWNLIIRGIRQIEPVADNHLIIDITLASDAMQDANEVAATLRGIADRIERSMLGTDESGVARDVNGNTVGTYEIKAVTR